MRKIIHLAQRVKPKYPNISVPIILLLVCGAAFGLLIPWLGFYQDDWHHVYHALHRGAPGLWDLLLHDNRPYAALVYIAGFSLLGYTPLHWHIAAFTLRSLTVIMVWLGLRRIWPQQERQAAWTALLFAVYPLFKLQPLSVAYSLHWTGYLLFAVSIWAMVQSLRQPRCYWCFTLLAALTSALELLFLEYYAGVELIRPFLLWMLTAGEAVSWRRRLVKSLQHWLPYLLVYLGFVVNRFYLQPTPGYQHELPALVLEVSRAPLAAAAHLAQAAIQDGIAILFSAWNQVINPQVFELNRPSDLYALVIAILVGAGLFVYLSRLGSKEDEALHPPGAWHRSALWLGLLLMLLGPLPGWVSGQLISKNNPLWSDRLGLAAMIGASLTIVALLEALVERKKIRLILCCFLIGAAVNWHILNANEYRWSWEKQKRFYHQLFIRAPYVLPGTAFLSDGEIFPFMGEYPTAFALGSLYPKRDLSPAIDYWYFSLYKHFNDRREDLISGIPLQDGNLSASFFGDSRDSLVIYFEPEKNRCLWVLRPEDADIRILPEITRDVAAVSNLKRIQPDSPLRQPLPVTIFGKETSLGWCAYYQAADLARQFGEWKQVTALWSEARINGFSPGNGVEFLPFIEASAQLGQWEQAQEMTLQANKITEAMRPILCSTWNRLVASTSPSLQREAAWMRVSEKVRCQEQDEPSLP